MYPLVMHIANLMQVEIINNNMIIVHPYTYVHINVLTIIRDFRVPPNIEKTSLVLCTQYSDLHYYGVESSDHYNIGQLLK
jgi:hypothetical protein